MKGLSQTNLLMLSLLKSFSASVDYVNYKNVNDCFVFSWFKRESSGENSAFLPLQSMTAVFIKFKCN